MVLRIIILSLISFQLSFSTSFSDDWGQTGHRVIGEIATQYLNKKALKAVEKILHGSSLAYVSTYPDEIKSDKHFKAYSPYHYINIPLEVDYEVSKSNEEGDLYKGIQKSIAVLKDKNASDQEKEFQLKLLVHFIGDLHQPMHIGREEDRGGNSIRLKWFGKSTNLHRIWDSDLIEYFNMSYTEWSSNFPRQNWKTQKELQATSVLDWVAESHELVETIYRATPENSSLGYEYTYDYKEVLRTQLLKGGIRLAGILNSIFG